MNSPTRYTSVTFCAYELRSQVILLLPFCFVVSVLNFVAGNSLVTSRTAALHGHFRNTFRSRGRYRRGTRDNGIWRYSIINRFRFVLSGDGLGNVFPYRVRIGMSTTQHQGGNAKKGNYPSWHRRPPAVFFATPDPSHFPLVVDNIAGKGKGGGPLFVAALRVLIDFGIIYAAFPTNQEL